jgi:hypothetical protein
VFRRNFGNLTNKKKNNSNSSHDEVRLTNSEDNFGKAKDNLLHTLDQVEKKVLRVAEQVIHDEVDVLFGKDHGSGRAGATIKKTSSSVKKQQQPQPIFPMKPRKFSYRTDPEANPLPNHKMTMDVKATNVPCEKKFLPHSPFLDLMESYAENCHAQFGF